jgi:hypothetical protein
MKRIPLLISLTGLIVGCSRNYDVNFPAVQSDAAGTWVLSSAPQAVTNRFPASLTATLTLSNNGKAIYASLPIEKDPQTGSVRSDPARWTLVSGAGTWEFSDMGRKDRHIWTVHLHTETAGVQLTLGKRSGEMILLNTPDPDSPERVEFQRARK